MKRLRVECDSCDGSGVNGFDEEGKPYSCYRCGETGWMVPEDDSGDGAPDPEPPFDPAYADREAAKWFGDRFN